MQTHLDTSTHTSAISNELKTLDSEVKANEEGLLLVKMYRSLEKGDLKEFDEKYG